MKRSRYIEEQTLSSLNEVDARRQVPDMCHQMGINEATFYVWKKRHGKLALPEVRELRQLRDETTVRSVALARTFV